MSGLPSAGASPTSSPHLSFPLWETGAPVPTFPIYGVAWGDTRVRPGVTHSLGGFGRVCVSLNRESTLHSSVRMS